MSPLSWRHIVITQSFIQNWEMLKLMKAVFFTFLLTYAEAGEIYEENYSLDEVWFALEQHEINFWVLNKILKNNNK